MRPVCAHCHKLYGKRITTNPVLVWRAGEARPPYRGNGIVTAETEFAPLCDIEKALGRPRQPDDRYVRLDVWDGESWTAPHEPFCTLRCALDYARKAYRRLA